MQGYIYTMAGADPGHGWILNDTDLRARSHSRSMRTEHKARGAGGRQYFRCEWQGSRRPAICRWWVPGSRKDQCVGRLQALSRESARPGPVDVRGNIIVTGNGQHHPLDDHDNFARRVENYIVGRKPVYLENPREYNAAREESLDVLSRIFKRRGRRIFDVIGRYRKMNSDQVKRSAHVDARNQAMTSSNELLQLLRARRMSPFDLGRLAEIAEPRIEEIVAGADASLGELRRFLGSQGEHR